MFLHFMPQHLCQKLMARVCLRKHICLLVVKFGQFSCPARWHTVQDLVDATRLKRKLRGRLYLRTWNLRERP